MDHIPLSRLHQAVDAGIINAAQLDALLALEAGPGDSLDALPAQVEEQKGLNAISVAYWGGAIAVLFAFGWFLVDRWQVLGPGGVLVVTVVYAGLFALAARLLMRAGFHTAAALAALCVVGMTPIIAWAALALAGLWELYETGQRLAVAPPPWDTLRWLPIDLATILAALVALRRVRFAVLALPVAIALWALLGHASSAFIDPESLVYMWDRVHLVAATVLLGAAYSLDQRARHAEDYAFWFYLVGLVALTVAIGGIWNEATKLLVAHATLALAILLVVAALRLRRRVFIAFAVLGFLSYLGYLAFDVFRKTVGFPIVLATCGLVVILVTVLAQQRYPELVRRMDADRLTQRTIPGARVIFPSAVVVALALFAAHLPAAREQAGEQAKRDRVRAWQVHNRRKLDAVRREAGLPPMKPLRTIQPSHH